METLLDVIQLQQLYITSLNNIKSREFFLASEQLEQAYTLYDEVIDKIEPLSPIRDFVIQLRDYIIYDLKQINTYIYEKEEINVSTIENIDNIDNDIEEFYIEPTPIVYDWKNFLHDYFPCCLRYKFKID